MMILKGNQLEKDQEATLKKITPLHTKDWYIKWTASSILLIGMLLTSNNIFPINLFFHVVGLSGWLTVAFMWNDRALIIVNSVSIAILTNGIINYYVT